jgi:glycosyltransferase involved in cell wall biosynthesis
MTKGGGEYLFMTMAKNLTKNGHKVWVITNKVKNELYQDTDNLKILTVNPQLEYKGGLPPSFLDNVKYVVNSYRRGKSIIKNENIDLIHSNNFSPALAGSLLSYFTKIPHITTIHDIFSIYDDEFWKKWALQSNVSHTSARLIPFFEKLMMKFKVDCIHTVSEATKKDIEKIGTKKPINIIPNCIQDEDQVSITPKTNQFVYLGRLVFYKNIEVVLKAFKIAVNEFPNIKLVIAGDGPHKKSLQEIVKDLSIDKNVDFIGYIAPQDKAKLLAESNALLFPSLIEGFGLVMLEAFQQKRPVLVSKITPMSDIIENKKTGLIVDPYDENEWAKAITWIIKNPHESERMGIKGNQLLEEKYNEKLFYENLIKMYETVLINNK